MGRLLSRRPPPRNTFAENAGMMGDVGNETAEIGGEIQKVFDVDFTSDNPLQRLVWLDQV